MKNIQFNFKRFFLIFIVIISPLFLVTKFIFSFPYFVLLFYIAPFTLFVSLIIHLFIGLWNMVKDKSIKIKGFVLLMSLIVSIGFYHVLFPKIPVSFDNIEKIELGEIDGKPVVITQPKEIEEFTSHLKDASGESSLLFGKSYPACPFGGMKFVIYYKGKIKKKVEIFLATDDCGTLKYLDNYYDISESDNNKLRNLLRKLDVYYQGA